MKLLRIGEPNREIVAVLDEDGKLRDLSDHIEDLNPITLNENTLLFVPRLRFFTAVEERL